MTSKLLLLNKDKTEVIVFCPKNFKNMVSDQIVILDYITVASVRNQDQDIFFSVHIQQICRTAVLHICKSSKTRNILRVMLKH